MALLAWAVFTALYAALSLRRFAAYATPSWDNAIFEQAIKAYAHLQAPIVDIKAPGFNILGDHFSPVTALLAPVYRVFPHAQTLLVAQAILVSASVVPIGRVAIRRLGLRAGIAVILAYGLSFGLQSAVYTDFHEVAFAAPLLAFAGASFTEGRWRAVAAWSLPLLLVKEDMGLTVAAIGIAVAIRGPRRSGLLLAGAGVAGALLTMFVIIPAFNPADGYGYFSLVGGGGGAFTTLFTGWSEKWPTLLLTFGITGFLALASPWALVAVPTLAWRFVGDKSYYWGTNFHYSLVLMPVVFIAMVDACRRLCRSPRDWVRGWARIGPVVAAVLAVMLTVYFPLRTLALPPTAQQARQAVAAREALAAVPAGTSVESDRALITHLVSRHTVYWYATIGGVIPDYVVIKTDSGVDTDDVVAFAAHQHPGTTWRLAFDRDTYQVAQLTGCPGSGGAGQVQPGEGQRLGQVCRAVTGVPPAS